MNTLGSYKNSSSESSAIHLIPMNFLKEIFPFFNKFFLSSHGLIFHGSGYICEVRSYVSLPEKYLVLERKFFCVEVCFPYYIVVPFLYTFTIILEHYQNC